MMTFKHFLHDPINATSYGYEALYIDYCALWCYRFSFKITKSFLFEWKAVFTHYSVVEFPLEFLKLLIATILYLSIPAMFPLYALLSYALENKLSKERREHRNKAMKDF